MQYTLLSLTSPHQHVGLVTLNRPKAANALNIMLAQELTGCLHEAQRHYRVLILTGVGDRAFCAGADLKERQGMSEDEWETQHAALRAARDAVLLCPIPIMAAVNGAAMGGGLELALSCDFIYASEGARFGLTEATLGIMPGMGGTQLLPRAIGSAAAAEMLFTGKPIDAEEALRLGLVNRICESEALLPLTVETARHIADNAPRALQSIKQSMRNGALLPMLQAFGAEREQYLCVVATNDRREGISAFNEKRKPVFKGE